jgi:hypothetical protein
MKSFIVSIFASYLFLTLVNNWRQSRFNSAGLFLRHSCHQPDEKDQQVRDGGQVAARHGQLHLTVFEDLDGLQEKF